MEKKNAGSLPYLQGGVPGAIRAFAGAEAVLSIISCVVYAVSTVVMISEGSWTNLLMLLLPVIGAVLAFKLFTGLNRLSRNSFSGAESAESAIRGRRIMIWVSFALILAVQLFSTVSYHAGAAVLSLLLSAGFSLLIILPLVSYYRDCELVMNHIFREMYDGQGIRTAGAGRLSGLCITFAVILLVLSGLICTADIWDTGHYLDYSTRNYFEWFALLLYLYAARFLLVNQGYLGFLRSHTSITEDSVSLSPSGTCSSPSICILGSVSLGWFAFSGFLYFFSDLVSYRGFLSPDYAMKAIYVAAYILLGIALIRTRGRTVLTLIGASVAAAAEMYHLIMRFGYVTGSVSNTLYFFYCASLLSFYLLLIAMTVLRRSGKSVPPICLILMIILASLSVLFPTAAYFAGYSDFVYLLFRLSTHLLYLLPLLGLVRMLAVPDSPDSVSGEEEPVKKPVVNLQKSEE